MNLFRTCAAALGLALLLGSALPAAAQDLLSGESKNESASDVLQKLLLGKIKEKGATTATTGSTAGTKAGTGTAASGTTSSSTGERLPRKAAGNATKPEAQPDSTAAKPRANKRPPIRRADLPSLPRLKPTAPISASPTIQPPKPIPMPPGSLP